MSDAEFHEIQLNGKQLVFLFMAATVISVVIFLCGVLVGRGVRAEQGDATIAAIAPDPGAARAPEAAPAEPPTTAPPPLADELSYYDRLQRQESPRENLKAPATGAPPASSSVAFPSEPPGTGFAVQVAALREPVEADSIVQRLVEKGYPAYVVAPVAGAPAAVYRVRVGKFNSRREAEDVASRLEKEEQFKPWIVR